MVAPNGPSRPARRPNVVVIDWTRAARVCELLLEAEAMSDCDQNELERIAKLVAESLTKDVNRPKAIHEAAHAVAALHLRLPLIEVNIEERDNRRGRG